MSKRKSVRVSESERIFLSYGLSQPGGKLPLFDGEGQKISHAVISSCLEKGLAERWFANPIKPDWLVCRLTEKGREAARA